MPYRTLQPPQVLDVFVFRLEVSSSGEARGLDGSAIREMINENLTNLYDGMTARCELESNLKQPAPHKPDCGTLAAIINMPSKDVSDALHSGDGYLDMARHMTQNCQSPEHFNNIIAALVREIALGT